MEKETCPPHTHRHAQNIIISRSKPITNFGLSFPCEHFLYHGNTWKQFPLTHLPHNLCLWNSNLFSIIYQFHFSFQVSILHPPLPLLFTNNEKKRTYQAGNWRPCKYKERGINIKLLWTTTQRSVIIFLFSTCMTPSLQEL